MRRGDTGAMIRSRSASSAPAGYGFHVCVQYGGMKRRVKIEQPSGDERGEVWEQVVARAPNFGAYPPRTDREIPVLRTHPSVLTPRANRAGRRDNATGTR